MRTLLAMVLLLLAFTPCLADENDKSKISHSAALQKLDEASLKAINNVAQWIESAGTFTEEQAPLLCREILTYNMIMSILGIALGIVIMVIAIIITRKLKALADNNRETWAKDGLCALLMARIGLGCIGFMIALAFLVPNIDSLLKITLAPRLYLIEQFSHTIN